MASTKCDIEKDMIPIKRDAAVKMLLFCYICIQMSINNINDTTICSDLLATLFRQNYPYTDPMKRKAIPLCTAYVADVNSIPGLYIYYSSHNIQTAIVFTPLVFSRGSCVNVLFMARLTIVRGPYRCIFCFHRKWYLWVSKRLLV